MSWNSLFFEAVLTWGAIGAGLLWLAQRALAAKGMLNFLGTYPRFFFTVLALAVVVRSFAYEPYRIPSSSMEPTLFPGDFILVDKHIYGLRLPVSGTAITDGEPPRRGEIVVFRFPADHTESFIKRIVGIGGDRIRFDDTGQLFINGKIVPQTEIGSYPYKIEYRGRKVRVAGKLMRERIDQIEHEIISIPALLRPETNRVFEVPEDHYFVLGDHRNNSNDSRYWGFVPRSLIVGRASVIWLHYGEDGLDGGRFGLSIH